MLPEWARRVARFHVAVQIAHMSAARISHGSANNSRRGRLLAGLGGGRAYSRAAPVQVIAAASVIRRQLTPRYGQASLAREVADLPGQSAVITAVS